MTSIHARLLEIDRVWNDQVLYANQQRKQHIQQSVTEFLQKHQQTLHNAYRKIDGIDQEKQRLQQQVSALTRKDPECMMVHTYGANNIDELIVDVHQLGLRLAQAWNLRAGTRDDIESQFKARGLESGTVQRMCNTAGFWEDLEQQLAPRRSERLQTATDQTFADVVQ